jgi:pectinesterase
MLRSALFLLAATAFAQPRPVTVSDAPGLQVALDAAGPEGAIIRLHPGIYRQVFTIAKPRIQLRGLGTKPQDVVLTFEPVRPAAPRNRRR